LRSRLIQKRIAIVLAALLLAFGSFAFGFISRSHVKTEVQTDVRKKYLAQQGNATPVERSEVLATLREFQEGYVKRDPKAVNTFMDRLFVNGEDVLLMGTDSGEWARGYPAVAEFIKRDWIGWGDFRFAVEDSLVWCTGDVAWIVSLGSERGRVTERPVRFSAILARNGGTWHFRQVHFQWDDSDPGAASLLQTRTYSTLFRWVLRAVWAKTVLWLNLGDGVR
jgi:SnoaL-like domain